VRLPWSRFRPEPGVRPRLVKVAYAPNLPQAELIQGLLRQEHIPSMVRRNAGFDVPDFIAAGARDVLVAEADAERARELLA